MKKYKKLFGVIVEHVQGDLIRIQDLVDILYPLAYKDSSEDSYAIRTILEQEIWGMKKQKESILNKPNLNSEKTSSALDFFAFIYQALLEKEKHYEDKYRFRVSTMRKWLQLKYKEWQHLSGKESK